MIFAPPCRILFVGTLLVSAATAQDPRSDPIGQIHPRARPLSEIATLVVPPLDRAECAREDLTRELTGLPPRFAMPNAVNATTATHGIWETLDGTRSLWRLRVRAPGADHVNLGFTRFWLPATAQLRVYSADYTDLVRPFDARDHTPAGDLWTPVVTSEEIVLELVVRTAERADVELALGQVNAGYRFFGAGPSAIPAADAGACNIDVACPMGDAWSAEIPSVAVYSLEGSVVCTGFMVNNTAQDRRNFFMTAEHCGVTSFNASTMVVYWNYQHSSCGGGDADLSQFSSGAFHRASFGPSDFTLVELFNPPDQNWGVTYAGWDRSAVNATSAVAIHHPTGGPKKISFENNPTRTTSYLGFAEPGNGLYFRVVDWDDGTTEAGSSGSPLFDQNHRVIGQLTGGQAACGNNDSDWYGKFAGSWIGGGTGSTSLSGWLDPLGTGAMFIDTLVPEVATATSYGVGCYESFASFYEEFADTTFDLGFSSLVLTPNGTGYTATSGPGAWFNPVSANLGLGDDSVSGPLPLPFSFQHPGGTTNLLRMCSNGYIWLDGSSTGADFSASASELVDEAARLAPLWMDLDPTDSGTTHYDLDPGGQAVYLTWLGVAEFFIGGANDIQCVIRSDGEVEFRWRSASNLTQSALVGYSPGGGSLAPDGTDISTSTPFGTGFDVRGLALRPINPPVLGSTFDLSVDNIPAGSLLGGLFFGSKIDPGLDLGLFGLPGCQQYCTLSSSVGFGIPGVTAGISLPLPSNPAFAGLHVSLQVATLTPGVNAAEILTSNGIDMKVDIE